MNNGINIPEDEVYFHCSSDGEVTGDSSGFCT